MNADNTGFLLADVSRLMRRAFQKRMEGKAITFMQARVLFHVSRQQGIRQVELAELLEMQPISLVRLLDQLESQGVLERRTDPGDRRAYQLFLTDAAQPHLQAINEVAVALKQDVLGNLSDSEASALQRALTTMREKLTN